MSSGFADGLVRDSPVTSIDLARHAPARFDRTSRLERSAIAFPDGAVARLPRKIHTIELLENVFQFVSDELGGSRRRPEIDVRGHRQVSLKGEGGACIGQRRAGWLIVW
jgi:hypothetical protein